MKVFGAIIIVGVCWFLGIDFYKSNIRKLNFAKGLYDGIEVLKSEIVYSCELLGDSILKSASFSGDASEFMNVMGNDLQETGVSVELIFDRAEPYLFKNTNKETYLLTKDLFFQLGEKDCENQTKLLEGFLNKLRTIINRQNDFCQKECVMFKKVGVVVGLGIAVLLI